MNPYVILAGVVMMGLAIAGAGWQGFRMGSDHEIASQAKQDTVVKAAREAMLTAAAEAIAGIQVRHTTIRQPVEREIRENTVYRECHHSPDAFGLLNLAIQDSAAPDEPPRDRQLPEANTPH